VKPDLILDTVYIRSEVELCVEGRAAEQQASAVTAALQTPEVHHQTHRPALVSHQTGPTVAATSHR